MRFCSLVLLLLVVAATTDAAQPRRWTDASGAFSVEAELVAVNDDSVSLKTTDGKALTVPLARLSPADRDFLKAAPSLRKWHIVDTKEEYQAELVGGAAGVVQLKKADGAIASVALDSLAPDDRRWAFESLGIALIDFSGVWRSDSGSYYAMTDGTDGKVYLRLLQSPHLRSVEGVLIRQKERLTSEQWLAVFAEDPSKQVRSMEAEFFTTPDGLVRFKFDFIYVDRRGVEDRRRRKKVTSAFVRLTGDQIPQEVLDRFLNRPTRGPEDVYEHALNKMVTVVGVHWYSKQRKVSIGDSLAGRGPSETIGFAEAIVNAFSTGARNRMIVSIIDSLFPVYSAREREASESVVVEYLEAKATLERMDRSSVEKWARDHLADHLGDTGTKFEEMGRFVRFIGDVDAKVKKSWVSRLPD